MPINKRSLFPLFQTPIDLSHSYWDKLIKPGDTVIDATCGNGHDTLFLSQKLLSENQDGNVIALDCQDDAIQNSKERLLKFLSKEQFLKVKFYTQCHSTFPLELSPSSIKLIVYNLGYLPSGDKNYTTKKDTTLESITAALPLIVPNGAISITCYPGHAEGEKEEISILNFCKSLNPLEWSSCHHQWLNRNKAPSLIILQKSS